MQRLFSTFATGWPGIGLLLLRVALGTVAILEGRSFVQTGNASVPLGLVAIAAGILLLLGLLTPLAGALAACGALGRVLGVIPTPANNLLDGTLFQGFVALVAVAVVFLGPGALSVDARLFGRREIIIPRPPQR